LKIFTRQNNLILFYATTFAVLFSLFLVHIQMLYFWDGYNKEMGYWLGFWTPLIDAFVVVALAVYFKQLDIKNIEKDHELAHKYLNLSGNMIVCLNSDGVITNINKEGCIVLEADNKNKIIGLNWFDNFIPPEKKEDVKNIFNQLMHSNQKYFENVEDYIVTKKGNKLLISWRNTLLYDNDGKITGTISSGKDITTEKKLHEQLKKSRQRFKDMFKYSPAGIFYFDSSWVIKEVNEKFASILGTEVDKLKDFDMKERVKNQAVLDAIDNMFRTGSGKFEGYYTSVTANKTRYLIIELRCIKDDNGNITGGVGISEDLTQEHELKQKLNEHHKHLQNVIDGMDESITVIDKDYNVLLMNKSAKKMLNKNYVSDITSPKCHELSHHSKKPCDTANHPCPLKDAIKTKNTQKALHKHYNVDDEELLLEVSITPLLDKDGEVYAFVESGHDVTELLKMKDDLNKQINYDSLTELPNRTLYMDLLKEYIKHAKRSISKAAVILVDLDHFKIINDSFGHQEGDRLIQTFAELIQSTVREEDTTARFGGDSFAILLEDIEDDLAPVRILEELKQVLENSSIIINEQHVNITFSAGISIFPEDGDTPENLFKNSDAALYEAKEMGRDTYKYYTNELTQKAFERVVMDSSLRDAVKNEDFVLYYQPQYNLKTQKLIGMEALIRWNHHSMGIIAPAKFITALEGSSLIIPVGEWIIKTAFESAVKWREDGYEPGIISINLSIVQLNDGDKLLKVIKVLLEQTKCMAEWIGIEVTESMMMKDPQKAIDVLHKLKEMGFQISVDDFGTGYSSLTYLKKMPIDKLKIDQSFIRDLPQDKEDAELTSTIIVMAKNLHLEVIAEGVETQEQKDFLVKHGCFEAQGYFYDKPLTEKDILIHLKT